MMAQFTDIYASLGLYELRVKEWHLLCFVCSDCAWWSRVLQTTWWRSATWTRCYSPSTPPCQRRSSKLTWWEEGHFLRMTYGNFFQIQIWKIAILTPITVFMKTIRHIGHFRWLGPYVWWEISQIWIEYIKPIRQMSDESWKFFGYSAINGLVQEFRLQY